MGRLRTKEYPLAPGWHRHSNGRLYYTPTRRPERKTPTIPPEGPLVYFVRAHGSALKIGFATSKKHLASRIKMLRVGSPIALLLLGAVAGSRIEERSAHKILAPYRIRGEWFKGREVTSRVRTWLRVGRIV